MKIKEVDAQLKALYARWLAEIKQKAPELLDEEFSNPYYACVPQGWCASPVRILIIGEEGAGTWGRGKSEGVAADEIDKIQAFGWQTLASNLEDDIEHDLYKAKREAAIPSPFWKRAGELRKYGVCAWTNMDTIHRLSEKKCQLSDEERTKLHSLNIKLLSEEIQILQPTHIVFAGWYGTVLESEFPALFKKLYPGGLGDTSVWKKKVVPIEMNGIHFIVAYHPNWGVRTAGYEDWVLEEFRKTLKKADDTNIRHTVLADEGLKTWKKKKVRNILIMILAGVVLCFPLLPLGLLLIVIGCICSLRYTVVLKKRIRQAETVLQQTSGNPYVDGAEKKRREENREKQAKESSQRPRKSTAQSASRQRNRAAEMATTATAAYAAGKVGNDSVKKTNAYQRTAKNLHANQSTLERQMSLQGQQGRNRNTGVRAGKEKLVAHGRTYYIVTSSNGDQVLQDVGGRRLGRYDRLKNETRDAGLRIVGKGNCLRDLID